jgi:hypothetical protein
VSFSNPAVAFDRGAFTVRVHHKQIAARRSQPARRDAGDSDVSVGTELDIAQAGVPDVIPPEACYLGWQDSLRNLARLVEPEINQ